MGYEEDFAAQPSRDQELAMISRYANDFIAQPSYKIYQNMSRRKTDMEIAAEFNKVKRHYWMNFSLGMLIGAPFVYLSSGFFQRTSSGVPYTYRPKYYFTAPKYYNQDKRIRLVLLQVTLWTLFASFYANRYTHSEFLEDEMLENYKVHKML